jgi:N-formylglutamate deformylase
VKLVDVHRGEGALLLAQPHCGLWLPDDILGRLNDRGRKLADTDWHINRLYEGLAENATIVTAQAHRYVVDANRDPTDSSLYPGQNTTSLCPTTDFYGEPIYQPGQSPSADEVEQRQQTYHQPYHDALAEELQRLHRLHGYVILYDCHSIRSRVPFLFEGILPDLNIGTNSGLSCDAVLQRAVAETCETYLPSEQYSWVENGRFRGGWTTRHYGQPDTGYHALQMEISQRCYMEEEQPWRYLPAKARQLRALLKKLLSALQIEKPLAGTP